MARGRRTATGHEARHRQRRPVRAACATRGAPRPSRSRARATSKATSARTGSGDGEAAEVVRATAEPRHVLLRQVDAAGGEVLADVLQVLDDLQAGADASESSIRAGVATPKTCSTSRPTGSADSRQ